MLAFAPTDLCWTDVSLAYSLSRSLPCRRLAVAVNAARAAFALISLPPVTEKEIHSCVQDAVVSAIAAARRGELEPGRKLVGREVPSIDVAVFAIDDRAFVDSIDGR